MNNEHKIVFLFSGQGSQYRGMGKWLFDNHSTFRQSLEKSDALIHSYTGRSVIRELYHQKSLNFDALLVTHPAIVAVELAMYRVLQAMGIEPDYVVGSSLGEFAAAVVQGAWSETTAIQAAIAQAQAFVDNGIEGGMLAVINERSAALEIEYKKHDLYLAADNFAEHFTVSGLSYHLDAFEQKLKRQGIPYLRLPVRYPFHSPLVSGARAEFLTYMEEQAGELNAMKLGFVSGWEAREKQRLGKDYFWQAVNGYSNFSEVVNTLEEKAPCHYIDLGPSGTMATFVKYNLSATSRSEIIPIMTPFCRERYQLRYLQETLCKNVLIK